LLQLVLCSVTLIKKGTRSSVPNKAQVKEKCQIKRHKEALTISRLILAQTGVEIRKYGHRDQSR
jgi:hypothetical protein